MSGSETDDIFPKIERPKSTPMFSVPGEADQKKADAPAEPEPAKADTPTPTTENPVTSKKRGRKPATEKLCPRCMKVKPIEEFPLIKKDDPKKRRRPRCMPCWPEYQKEYRADKEKGKGKKKRKKAAKKKVAKKVAKKATAKKTRKKSTNGRRKKKAATRTTAKKDNGRRKAARRTTTRQTNNAPTNPVRAAKAVIKDLMWQRKRIDKQITKAEKHLTKAEKWWERGQSFM